MKHSFTSSSSLILTSFAALLLAGCSAGGDAPETAINEPETIIAEDLAAPVDLNDEEAVQSALTQSGDAQTVTTFSADGSQISNAGGNSASLALGEGCPTVQILSDAQSITYFDEDMSQSITPGIIARASLSEVRGGCELTAEGLEVDLDMLMSGMISTKGRFQGRDDLEAFMTFPYFVAVFDEAGRPYSKQILATAMRFEPLEERTEHAEKITQTIPIANQSNMNQFTITVGFQLNRRQLAYNKAQGLDTLRNTAPATGDVTQGMSETPEGTETATPVSGQMEPILE